MSSERKPPDDRELDDFLAGKHPVGRAYREVSEQETAPRELDDAILRMAREQAASKPEAVPLRRRPRWIQPLALAATLALSLSVLLNIWREPALRKQAVPMEQGGEEAVDGATRPSSELAAAAVAPIEGPRPDHSFALQPSAKLEPPSTPEGRRAESSRPERDDALADAVSPSVVSPRSAAPLATAPPPPPPSPAVEAQGGAAVAPRPDIHPELMERGDPKFDFYSLREDGSERVQEKKRMGSEDARELAKPKTSVQKSIAAEAAPAMEAEDSANRSKEERARESRDLLIERARAAVVRGDVTEARRLVAEMQRLYPEANVPEDLRGYAPPQP